MKILITQAKKSNDIEVLKNQLTLQNFDIIVFPEGYISNESLLNACCELAKKYKTPIISSYLDDTLKKDFAVVIDEHGQKVLHRKKSLIEGPLLEPSKTLINNINIGYMLCCEIFLDNIDFSDVDIIFNPIGVGMFSDEQYTQWSERAKALAKRNNCYVIGASHSDGSYRNCGVSIPIGYVYDNKGKDIYLSKEDTRSVIVNLVSKEVLYL